MNIYHILDEKEKTERLSDSRRIPMTIGNAIRANELNQKMEWIGCCEIAGRKRKKTGLSRVCRSYAGGLRESRRAQRSGYREQR